MNRRSVLLDCKPLTLTYPGECKPALDGVTFAVHEGESIAIIGPSGAGKSTLLSALHEKVTESSLIHQEYLLVPQLSLFHNIYMGKLDTFNTLYSMLNLCFPQKKVYREIYEICQKLDIHGLLKKKCCEISGGEQQRTAVARALFRKSNICFADEPVSAMDPENASRTLALLTSQMTVVASMHNTTLACLHFDRIIGLRAGQIVFDLSSHEVTQQALDRLYRQ